MAFLSGPVSFQRFFISGRFPEEATDALFAALSEHTFGKLPAQSDGSHFGWVGPHHLFETELIPEQIATGRFVSLAMRVDTTRVPGNVLKSYIRLEEDAAREAAGKEHLSRGEKRRARDAATLRAEQEAAAGAFRKMQAYPVLIDLEQRTVYLGNLSTKAADRLLELFANTFEATLELGDADGVALQRMISAGSARALEQLSPFTLVSPPDSLAESSVDSLGGDQRFLGKEFLTWLWYRSDAEAGPFRVRSGDEVTVMLDKTVRLRCDFGLTGTNVITADGPTTLPEARAALAGGKQAVKAGLIVGSPWGEFRFTLDGLRLNVSSLILPEDEAQVQDPRERIEQRYELITDAASLLDALFESFLLRRTSSDFTRTDLAAMTTWARQGAANAPLAASA